MILFDLLWISPIKINQHSASMWAVLLLLLRPKSLLPGTLARGLLSTCVVLSSRKPAVLLDQLFSIGVNGKTWCLIRSWYENGRCCVKVDGRSSPTFSVERGVHQGSVLLPTLFNIVMDPLLRSIEAADLGLCVNNLYGGAYLHTDDIRTVATSVSTLRVQISKVLEFASYHWSHDLSAKPSVGYNITKA